MAGGGHSTGLFGSVRRFFETVLATVQNRFELFTVELQEEKHRFIETLVWTAAAVILAVVALLLITLTIIFLVNEQSRVYVMGGFSLVYLFLAIGAWCGVRNRFKHRPPPFSETINEMKKDRAWLRSKK
jgi:uncharacterized membrane protein YqjE